MGLFDEQISRKPNNYLWTQDFIDVMWKGFWTPNEFNFLSDYHQFKTELSESERTVVINTLSAIGQIEVAVKTFWAKLGDNFPHPSMYDLGYVMANVECYSSDTEVLTPTGWKYIKDMKVGNPVMQYTNEGLVVETEVKDVVDKPYFGKMYKIYNDEIECLVTPNHNMVLFDTTHSFVQAKNFKDSIGTVPVYGEKISYASTTNLQIEEVEFDGRVSCIMVDSAMIVTRLNGKTFIAGNCYHNQAYEKLLSVLGLDEIFEQNLENEIVRGRVEYLRKHNKMVYADKRKQYAYSIILFTLFVENVSLFSQFYILLWLNRYRNILKDTAQQVAYTTKEETIHAMVGMKLVNTLREEYPEIFDEEFEELILKETRAAVEAEHKIIDWIMGDFREEGLNPEILKEFIANRMNESLEQIGYEPIFDVDLDLIEETKWFDEETKGNNMVDFFHQRPTEYAKKDKVYSADELF